MRNNPPAAPHCPRRGWPTYSPANRIRLTTSRTSSTPTPATFSATSPSKSPQRQPPPVSSNLRANNSSYHGCNAQNLPMFPSSKTQSRSFCASRSLLNPPSPPLGHLTQQCHRPSPLILPHSRLSNPPTSSPTNPYHFPPSKKPKSANPHPPTGTLTFGTLTPRIYSIPPFLISSLTIFAKEDRQRRARTDPPPVLLPLRISPPPIADNHANPLPTIC